MAEVRKAHVKRLYSVNGDGSLNQNIWIDVLRIDQIRMTHRGLENGATGLVTNFVYLWYDDGKFGFGDAQFEKGNTTRATTKMIMADPEDPSKALDLWIVQRQGFRLKEVQPELFDAWGQPGGGWRSNVLFDNYMADGSDGFPPADKRKADKIRVVNNDLAGLDMSKPVDWDTYQDALNRGSKDRSQDVDTEIVNFFEFRKSQFSRSGKFWNFNHNILNSPIKKIIDAGGAGKTSSGGPTKSYRFDPIETVVNVHWKAPETDLVYLAIQVGFLLAASGGDDTIPRPIMYGDPANWIPGVGPPPTPFSLPDIIGMWVWRRSQGGWSSSMAMPVPGLTYVSPPPAVSGLWQGSEFDLRVSVVGGSSGLGPEFPMSPPSDGFNPVTPMPFSQSPLLQVTQPAYGQTMTLDFSSVAVAGGTPGGPPDPTSQIFHCIGANAITDSANSVNGPFVYGGSPIFLLLSAHP